MAWQGFVATLVLTSKPDLGVLNGALDRFPLAGGITTFLRSLSSSFSIYSFSLLAMRMLRGRGFSTFVAS